MRGIPKVIHYCWISNQKHPRLMKKCIKSWKKHLPDYEFILWDFDKLKQENLLDIKWVKQAIDAKKYAFAADVVRCHALYHYGGIYLDCDVEVLKPFDDLLHREYILGYEQSTPPNVYIEAGVMGCKKEFSLMKNCLNYYKDRNFILKKGVFDTKSIPKIMRELIQSSNQKYEIFSDDYFSPKSWETKKIQITEKSYAIHHFLGSWISIRENIKNYRFISKTVNIFKKILPISFYNFLKNIYKKLLKI